MNLVVDAWSEQWSGRSFQPSQRHPTSSPFPLQVHVRTESRRCFHALHQSAASLRALGVLLRTAGDDLPQARLLYEDVLSTRAKLLHADGWASELPLEELAAAAAAATVAAAAEQAAA